MNRIIKRMAENIEELDRQAPGCTFDMLDDTAKDKAWDICLKYISRKTFSYNGFLLWLNNAINKAMNDNASNTGTYGYKATNLRDIKIDDAMFDCKFDISCYIGLKYGLINRMVDYLSYKLDKDVLNKAVTGLKVLYYNDLSVEAYVYDLQLSTLQGNVGIDCVEIEDMFSSYLTEEDELQEVVQAVVNYLGKMVYDALEKVLDYEHIQDKIFDEVDKQLSKIEFYRDGTPVDYMEFDEFKFE